MNKRKSLGYQMRYVCMMLACLLMVGCQEEEKWGTGNGTGFLVSLDDVSVEVTTRAASEEFNLVVTKDGTSDSKSYTLTAGSTQFVPVSVGTYNIKATSATELDGVSWNPYYVTEEKDVEIAEEDTQKSITLTAKYGCALVSVTFPEGLNEIFKDYHVTVAANSRSLELTPSRSQAYVEAGTEVSLSFGGTKLSGEVVKDKPLTHGNLPSTFAAADFYKITLAMGDDLTLDIAKVEEKTIDITEEIPLDWLPKPKMEAEGFTNNVLSMYESETPTAKFNFNLSSALQELKFTLNFQDETYKSLNKTYTLSELTTEDRTALTNAGVVLPEIGAKENVSLDFTGLVAKLVVKDNEALQNIIKLDEVKANNRQLEGDQTYTIDIKAPVFDINVYPGNTWTKQFTANTEISQGNVQTILSEFEFEYRTNNSSEWITSKDSLIQNLTPETAYQVRGKFRGHYTEVYDVKTYPVIELENGDMEDWYSTDGPEAGWPSKGPFWKRWYIRKDKDESTDGWCSLNYYTTSNNDPKAYCSNSGTEQTTDKHIGTYAAEIKTIGWGDNTAASPYSTIEHITPGELFLGRIINNEREYGISYVSRPTNLIFWYKYTPEGSHEFIAKVVIENKNENIVLAEEVFSGGKQDNYVEKNITINYKEEHKNIEPTHMYILFSSGENEKSEVDKASISRGSRHTGNVLYIDDISLVYDK